MAFATIQGADVQWDALDEFEALLVETPRRSVIHLRKGLGVDHQAWGVCHELAHKVLAHSPNSAYGFDSGRLDAAERTRYQLQEEVADTLASLWLHHFAGLAEICWALARSDNRLVLASWAQPGRNAEPPPAAAEPAKLAS